MARENVKHDEKSQDITPVRDFVEFKSALLSALDDPEVRTKLVKSLIEDLTFVQANELRPDAYRAPASLVSRLRK